MDSGAKVEILRTVPAFEAIEPEWAALAGSDLPVLGVQHAFGVYRRRSRRLFVNCFRRRLSLLGVSDAVRDDMRACLPGWPAERIATLYNRIDIAAVQAAQCSRAAAREHLGLPQDAWVIGNVGRLHPDKDQATLIRGFAQALPSLPPGSLLAIMGSGRLEAALKRLAGELGVGAAVRFLLDGAPPPADASAYRRIVLLFDGGDADAVAAARAHWSEGRAKGLDVTWWQADAQGRWSRRSES